MEIKKNTQEKIQQISAPKEFLEIIELLDKIEDYTSELRKKLIIEISKSNVDKISLNLDKIK
jgi:hypothetical protein